MRAGVCTIAFNSQPLQEAIRIARTAEAEGIEIWGKPSHTPYPPDAEAQKQALRLATQAGLEICCYGSYYRPGAAQKIDGWTVTWASELQIAQRLQTSMIRIWLGDRDYEATPAGDRARILAELAQAAEGAQAAGITIVLERHTNTLTNRWRGTAELLQEIGLGNVRLTYQVRAPQSLEEAHRELSRDHVTLLPLSAHAHLHNYRLTQEGMQRCHLDAGLIDYRDFSRQARACGFNGFGMVEFLPELMDSPDPAVALRRDLDLIRSL